MRLATTCSVIIAKPVRNATAERRRSRVATSVPTSPVELPETPSETKWAPILGVSIGRALAGETGSDNVAGMPVAWQVVGANPRAVVLIVQRQTPEAVQADTFVTYVAE